MIDWFKRWILGILGWSYLTSTSEKVWHTRRGYKMKYPPGRIGGATVVQRILGLFERKVFDSLEDVVSPGMTVINLGACYGDYAVYIAKLIGAEGRVYAFEPIPYFFELIETNAQLNGLSNIIAVNEAVSNREGTMQISSKPTDAYLFFKQIGNLQFSNFSKKFSLAKKDTKVPIVKLSSYINKENVKPDLILMDIEGFEIQVMQDMTSSIQEGVYKPIFIIETHELFHANPERYWQSVKDFCSRCNYNVKPIDSSHLLLIPEK